MISKKISRRDLVGVGSAALAMPFISRSFLGVAEAAAPKLGSWQPKYFRFNLGHFEITQISDSESFIDGPFPIIGANSSEEKVRALMAQNHMPETRYQPGFSPTVVNTGRELILFDTGNGENGFVPRPNGGWLANQLGPAGFKAEDIDIVVITHGHPDHVGGLMEGGKPLFPNARYVIGEKEYDFWAPAGKHSGDMEKLAVVFRTKTKLIADKFSFIKPGDDVVPGIRAVEAYGHTPGQLTFNIESDRQSIFIWADCAHHHVASLARPDWHCVFDIDKEMGAKTRKRIFDMLASQKIPVIGYHMPFPGLGYVDRLGPDSYRWIAHSFQLNP